MLKDFADDWSNCYASIIVHIAFIAVEIFDDGHNGAPLKLLRHVTVTQHDIE